MLCVAGFVACSRGGLWLPHFELYSGVLGLGRLVLVAGVCCLVVCVG